MEFFNKSEKGKKKVKQSIVLHADQGLYARLLVVAQARQLNMRDVFQYELGTVPWSIATVEGDLQKTSKAKLAPLLEVFRTPLETLLERACFILDGMAVLQSIQPIGLTFAAFAEQLLKSILRNNSPRIDFIID